MRLIVTAAAIVLALANDRSAVAQQAVSKESFSLPLPVKLTPKEEVDVRASLNNYISSRNVQPYRVVITMFNESSATVIGVVITESVSSDTGALSIPDAVAVVRSGLLANSYVMAAFTVGGPPSSTLVPSAIFAPFDGSGGDSSSNLTPLWIALAGVGIALLALLAILLLVIIICCFDKRVATGPPSGVRRPPVEYPITHRIRVYPDEQVPGTPLVVTKAGKFFITTPLPISRPASPAPPGTAGRANGGATPSSGPDGAAAKDPNAPPAPQHCEEMMLGAGTVFTPSPPPTRAAVVRHGTPEPQRGDVPSTPKAEPLVMPSDAVVVDDVTNDHVPVSTTRPTTSISGTRPLPFGTVPI